MVQALIDRTLLAYEQSMREALFAASPPLHLFWTKRRWRDERFTAYLDGRRGSDLPAPPLVKVMLWQH